MRKSFLMNLKIEKDIIDQIMEEYSNSVTLLEEKNQERLEKQIEKLTKEFEKKQSNSNQNDNDNNNDGTDWKKLYNEEKASHDLTKETYKNETVMASKKKATKNHLINDGVDKDIANLLLANFDLEKIELENENVKDWENICKPIKEQFSKFFATTETKGAQVATPLQGAKNTLGNNLKTPTQEIADLNSHRIIN